MMSEEKKQTTSEKTVKGANAFVIALLSGATAGVATDISLYPLDTIKTRLQSPHGFLKSGGFKGVYAGLGVAALGSAPGAALFFATYDTLLRYSEGSNDDKNKSKIQTTMNIMMAASVGEVMACLVRVPTEVVKQRFQANILGPNATISQAIRNLYRVEGFGGFYTGFGSTIMREIPFSLIQFPLYEFFKKGLAAWQNVNTESIQSYQAAVCGSVSGGIAAGLTTPLDVIKTRLMLGKDAQGQAYTTFSDTARRIYLEGNKTTKVFWSGIQPRIMWISIGGFVYFGAYEQARKLVTRTLA